MLTIVPRAVTLSPRGSRNATRSSWPGATGWSVASGEPADADVDRGGREAGGLGARALRRHDGDAGDGEGDAHARLHPAVDPLERLGRGQHERAGPARPVHDDGGDEAVDAPGGEDGGAQHHVRLRRRPRRLGDRDRQEVAVDDVELAPDAQRRARPGHEDQRPARDEQVLHVDVVLVHFSPRCLGRPSRALAPTTTSGDAPPESIGRGDDPPAVPSIGRNAAHLRVPRARNRTRPRPDVPVTPPCDGGAMTGRQRLFELPDPPATPPAGAAAAPAERQLTLLDGGAPPARVVAEPRHARRRQAGRRRRPRRARPHRPWPGRRRRPGAGAPGRVTATVPASRRPASSSLGWFGRRRRPLRSLATPPCSEEADERVQAVPVRRSPADARRVAGTRRQGAGWPGSRDADAAAPGGDPGQGAVHGRRPGRPRGGRLAAWLGALRPRRAGDHVRQPALDDPAVRGLLDGRGVERLLPPQPRRRADGAVGCVRSRHAPRLRQRPSPCDGRRRQGRCRHRLRRGHEDPLRRHPARPHERVDDHERRGAAGPGRLHRGG